MKLNKYIDHTLLKQDASQGQIDRCYLKRVSIISPVFVLTRLGLLIQRRGLKVQM